MDKVSPAKHIPFKYRFENRRLRKNKSNSGTINVKRSMTFWNSLKTILFIITLSVSIYLYFNLDYIEFSRKKVRLSEISKQLRTAVFHQHQPVELILKNMQKMEDNEWRTEMFVMPFIGTSGVSKTYVANIIKQNYYPTYVHSISKYDLVTNFEQTYFDVAKRLQDCCNLIIVDDLTFKDIDIITKFIVALPKHQVVLVIPIINIQDVSVINDELNFFANDKCIEEIMIKFTKARFNFENVLFHVLKKDDLEIAIIQLMIQKGIDYSKCGHLIKAIVDNHDIVTQGYKQLHHKLNVIWDCGAHENIYNAQDEL